MTTIGDIINAMRHGKEIADPVSWKNTQNTASILMSFAGIIVFILRFLGVDIHITDETLLTIATGLATVLGGVNAIITTASSSKVGIK